MTQAPPTLLALRDYWIAHGGEFLGIVGDARHVRAGTSYHLGRDDLRPGAYSAVTKRDVAGLSTFASAIDLGKVDGSFIGLRAFSRWYVTQCRENAADTRDVREVIYSPDGVRVLRWDRERGVASEPRDGEADSSHRTHTHISFYRDSRTRDQRPAFRRYFEPPPAHTLHIARGATVVTVTLGTGNPRCIATVHGEYGTPHRWDGDNSKAACGAPVQRRTCDGRSHATTVQVMGGVFKGQHVRIDPPSVTVS